MRLEVTVLVPLFREVNSNDWKGCGHLIDYSPLWETMKNKNMTQYKLLQNGIDNRTLDTLKKNNNITILTLEKICRILNCTPNDIVRFIDE